MHYRDGVSAVVVATRELFRPETPVRLRLWSGLVVCAALGLLAATSLSLSRVQDQVRIIGGQAVPQAATAADLYIALSDLDAQVARMVLVGDAAEPSGSQRDALGTYQQRSRQARQDMQAAVPAANR